MKKILFGITGLTIGGAERVLVDLANKLSEKYDITIFTIYAGGELEKELNIKLKSLYNVSYSELSTLKRKLIPLKILLFQKRIYNKYIKENFDIEVSFLEGPITRLFSVKNDNTKKIVWIHNDISLVFGKGFKAKLKRIIDEKIYMKYQKLVFVSKDNLDKFNNIYGNSKLAKKDKQVIYNYIDKNKILEKANEFQENELNKGSINFLTVARLVKQKAIDRIIKVHSKLIKEGINHHFYVIGDGPERKYLEDLIKQEGVENTFHLLGKKDNPYPYIKDTNYFCLLSEFEGYGMVLEEAKILNKNIIITDTAAREAVLDYNLKVIVPNSDEGIEQGIKQATLIKNDKTAEDDIQIYDNKKNIQDVVNLFENM